jgi:hypothetical protein
MNVKKVYSVIFLPYLIVLLLVTSVDGSSDEWVALGDDSYGDTFLYNKSKIEHITTDIVRVWDKVVYSDEGGKRWIQFNIKGTYSTEGYDKLSHTLFLTEIDCEKERYRHLSLTDYDKDGMVLTGRSYNEPHWSDIPPNSVMNTLRNEVCK